MEQKVATTPKALPAAFGAMPHSRIALETGMHSPWVNRRKDDRLDAQTLARLARIDPELLSPVKHRSAQAQADLTVIRARAGLVRARTALVNTARGLAKSYGERLRGCNVRNMNPEKAEGLSPELQTALQPFQVGDIAPGPYREIKARFDHRMERLERKSKRLLLDGLVTQGSA
jgi:transposase